MKPPPSHQLCRNHRLKPAITDRRLALPIHHYMTHSGGMFLPTTRAELADRGWDVCDVILVSGDTYIDSAFSGLAVTGRQLEAAGLRVGVIAQPDTDSSADILRLGHPRLFWGVTAGCVDSMVANYTALGKKRWQDDFTPGGENSRRPDRACIVYANLIRRFAKHPHPIVLGGIEASLRRVAHYDFWQDRIRKSILPDAKADYLLYGMADRSIVELAKTLAHQGDPRSIQGLCYLSADLPDGYTVLPSFEEVRTDPRAFIDMFHTFYRNCDPGNAKGLAQKQDTRWLIQNPPTKYLDTKELDALHERPFQNDAHPYYAAQGEVRALDTIRHSITTHRGCFGQCNFCAIAVHQGRTVRSRSIASVEREATTIARHPRFKGTISDVGGPTANMFGMGCAHMDAARPCADRRCLASGVCPQLRNTHAMQISLLERLRRIPGIRHVFVSSGIRHDLAVADQAHGNDYIEALAGHHVSGQLRLAPEHSVPRVLNGMGKPDMDPLVEFQRRFKKATQKANKKQYLTYYFIAAHPGCSLDDMQRLRTFASSTLGVQPRQVQVFTPTPSTYSTLMYATGLDPFTGKPMISERALRGKRAQLEAATGTSTTSRRTAQQPRRNRSHREAPRKRQG